MDKPDFLFEVCFETCNKVGGIYTVVSSKAMKMVENYEGYVIIGPYNQGKSEKEFVEKKVPDEFKEIFKELKEEGIRCHFGEWKIEGKPNTILIDFQEYKGVLEHLKMRYWEEFKIDSMNSEWDFFEPMLWSTAAGKLIEKYKEKNSTKSVIGHFHEWISGFGLLLLKLAKSPVKTVFTTHATMLGRSMSGNGKNLYALLDKIEPEKEAKEHGVMNKFSTEKACAEQADVFTTVSEITGIEAEKILGKKPDLLLLNGLDIREFPKTEKLHKIRDKSRKKLLEFADYFLGTSHLEDNNAKILFTSGRYEFRNKGIDIFVKALEQLNKEDDCEDIIAYFFVPNGWKNVYEEINDWERKKKHGKQNEDIKLCTHELETPDTDSLINALKESGLTNEKSSKVKCIVVPIYLEKNDGLFGMHYYDITSSCDLSVFASWYEPWGYTPPESLAIGVPTITTDQAGFGRFVNSLGELNNAVWVIERYMKDESDSIDELKGAIKEMLHRDTQLEDCRKISSKTDWKEFIQFYEKTYDLAIKK